MSQKKVYDDRDYRRSVVRISAYRIMRRKEPQRPVHREVHHSQDRRRRCDRTEGGRRCRCGDIRNEDDVRLLHIRYVRPREKGVGEYDHSLRTHICQHFRIQPGRGIGKGLPRKGQHRLQGRQDTVAVGRGPLHRDPRTLLDQYEALIPHGLFSHIVSDIPCKTTDISGSLILPSEQKNIQDVPEPKNRLGSATGWYPAASPSSELVYLLTGLELRPLVDEIIHDEDEDETDQEGREHQIVLSPMEVVSGEDADDDGDYPQYRDDLVALLYRDHSYHSHSVTPVASERASLWNSGSSTPAFFCFL